MGGGGGGTKTRVRVMGAESCSVRACVRVSVRACVRVRESVLSTAPPSGLRSESVGGQDGGFAACLLCPLVT